MSPVRLLACLLSVAFAASGPCCADRAQIRPRRTPSIRAANRLASQEAVPPVSCSAYNDHPKLAIILVIDQFRGDYLDRWRADFKNRGFDLFLDHGA